MRYNSFEKLEVTSNHCKADCEYITDFQRPWNPAMFRLLCVVDDYSARAMVGAAVAGYEEDVHGTTTSHPTSEQCKDVPNKGFVALWAEDEYTENGHIRLNIIGLYRHDFRVVMYKVRADELAKAIKQHPERFSQRLQNGLGEGAWAKFEG